MSKQEIEYNSELAYEWWNSLPIESKFGIKKRFEIFRNSSKQKKHKYPDIYDLRNIRITQLAEKHIVKMWEFKDKV